MAKKVRDYKLYLEDILDCIKKINKYTKGISFAKFSKDEKTIDAVIRNFQVIGEASRQLPQSFRDKCDDVDWIAMVNYRNVIVHEYFGVNLKITWDIVKNELPLLEAKVKGFLKTLRRNQNRVG